MSEAERFRAAVARIEDCWSEMRVETTLAQGPQTVLGSAGVSVDRVTYFVLRTLSTRGPLSVTELANHRGTDISTVSRQVARCEGTGLIRRAGSTRRGARLELTVTGEQVLASVRARRQSMFEGFLEAWTGDDLQQFVGFLERFSHDYIKELRGADGDQGTLRPASSKRGVAPFPRP